MAAPARQEREQEFHDRLYAGGDHVRGPAAKFYTAAGGAYDFYEKELRKLAPGRRVLEYGCGPGSYSFFLARNGAEVTGVDISPVAMERARETARSEGVDDKTTFEAMDCENLEFEDGTFDVVCGEGIIHHVDVRKSYREISRVLRDDGTAVFLEPLGHNPLINLYRGRTPELRTPDEHPLLTRISRWRASSSETSTCASSTSCRWRPCRCATRAGSSRFPRGCTRSTGCCSTGSHAPESTPGWSRWSCDGRRVR